MKLLPLTSRLEAIILVSVSKSFLLKFYLSDEREKKLYELLQNQENKKQFILDLMENYNLR